jgi:transposase
MKSYPSDLSEMEWLKVQAVLPVSKKGGRPPIHSKRVLINAILYIISNQCGWRNVPTGLPPWRAVYYTYHRWKRSGSWSKIYQCLNSVESNLSQESVAS